MLVKTIKLILKFYAKIDTEAKDALLKLYLYQDKDTSSGYQHSPVFNGLPQTRQPQFLQTLFIDFLKSHRDKLKLSGNTSHSTNIFLLLNESTPPLLKYKNVERIIDDLPAKKRKQLYHILKNLQQCGLLNQKTFDQAFALALDKLPKPEEVVVLEKNQEPTPHYTFDNNPPLRLADGDIKSGTYGAVYRGCGMLQESHKQYAVKKLHNKLEESDDMNDEMLRAARRETKHLRLLGRESFFFRHNNRLRVVAPWYNGTTPSNIPVSIKDLPTLERIGYVASLCEQVNHLHERYRAHGDLSVNNIIIDVKNKSIHIIDLGAAIKVDSHLDDGVHTSSTLDHSWIKHSGGSRFITNENGESYRFCDDVYAIGLLSAYLFPESFDVNLNVEFPIVKAHCLYTEPLHAFASALINAMLLPDRQARCTIKDAYHACTEVLKKGELVTDDEIGAILNVNIFHSSLTIDDAIHAHTRRTPQLLSMKP